MSTNKTRRNVLLGTGAAVSMGLAGCLGDDDPDPDEDPDADPDEDPDDEPAEWEPSQDMTVYIPFGEGGGTDTYARQLMPVMGDYWDVNIRIENLSSAGGMEAIGQAINATDPHEFTMYNPPSTNISWLLLDPPFSLNDLRGFGIYVRGSPSYLVVGQAEHEFEGLRDMVDRYNDGEFDALGVQDVGGPTSVIALTLEDLIDWDWGSMVNYGGSGPLSADLAAGDLDAGMPSSSGFAPVYESDPDPIDPVAYLYSEGAQISPLDDLDIDYLPDVYDVNVDSLTALNRIMLAPPDTEEHELETLEDGLEHAINHDDIIEWAEEGGWVIAPGDQFGGWEEADELNRTVNEEMQETLDVDALRAEFG